MKSILRALLLALAWTTHARSLMAQPPEGSQLPPEENNCLACHGEAELWEGDTLRLYVSRESLAEDVHFLRGVNCHDCHGGDPASFDVPEAHATEVGEDAQGVLPFRSPLDEVEKRCGHCHRDQAIELVKGMHAKAGEKDQRGAGTLMACGTCHGETVHGMLPVDDMRSPVFLDHQVETCGGCHPEAWDTYKRSVHGLGLSESGLLVTASCADCHGAHGVYLAADERSTLHPNNAAATCGACHRFIEERLAKSIHGRRDEATDPTEEGTLAANKKQTPTCTTCHRGHDFADPDSLVFRLQLPNRCGNCHQKLSSRYAMSIHGQLTELGYGPGAKCSDCHGAHDILSMEDPRSRLSAENRMATCRKCHLYASKNFLQFDPHADHTDRARDPLLYWVYRTLITLLIAVFGFFGLHSVLWFARSLIDALRHGRPGRLVPGETAYMRFGPFHRMSHTFLLVSFLGLALTGLPLKYSHYPWAKTLAYFLGGFQSTSVWHHVFGLVNLGCLVVYLARMVRHFFSGCRQGVSPRVLIFGPDSPVPNLRDVRDFFRMVGWFFGLGRKPAFERWSYAEKFDFWGAMAGIVILGSTGLILWFPNLFCSFLPGVSLNIAKVIHSTQALLATGFVFAIHFFNTHLRVEKFPADLSISTGLVSEEELRDERPEFFERMRREGKLEQLRATVPSAKTLWFAMLCGAVALAVGLGLLLGILAGALGG